jgi:hypothetical protein
MIMRLDAEQGAAIISGQMLLGAMAVIMHILFNAEPGIAFMVLVIPSIMLAVMSMDILMSIMTRILSPLFIWFKK